MRCSRCDVYDEQLCHYAIFLAVVYVTLNWQNLQFVAGYLLTFGAKWSLAGEFWHSTFFKCGHDKAGTNV